MLSNISNLGKNITSFQSFIGGIEREASKLNKVGLVELSHMQVTLPKFRILSILKAKWSVL